MHTFVLFCLFLSAYRSWDSSMLLHIYPEIISLYRWVVVPWMVILQFLSFFILLTIQGQLGYFQFLSITKKADMNILFQYRNITVFSTIKYFTRSLLSNRVVDLKGKHSRIHFFQNNLSFFKDLLPYMFTSLSDWISFHFL